jgi:hypothetical protein
MDRAELIMMSVSYDILIMYFAGPFFLAQNEGHKKLPAAMSYVQ